MSAGMIFFLRGRGFIGRPSGSDSPSLILRARLIHLSGCFVVPELGNRSGKELAPFTPLFHVIDDSRNQLFIFLFTVLLIEDAIALPLHVRAAEAVLGGFHIKAAPKTPAPHVAAEAEEKMVAVLSADRAFVGRLKIGAVLINIMNALCGKNNLVASLAILHIFTIEALV